MFKVATILGTRPEAIKLAPVILALREDSSLQCQVCATGQHRQMLDLVLQTFDLVPDVDLNLMKPNQTLTGLTADAAQALDAYYAEHKPDMVLVQGDTTTAFVAALTAFYHQISIGHVEAGLRTWNMMSPWPEEMNRVLISRLASLHFTPTESSRQNLRKEGIDDSSVSVTGNTVIDALFLILDKVKAAPPEIAGIPECLQPGALDGPRLILMTGHRRESFGKGFERICNAIADLAERFPDVHVVYPVHLNPNVRKPVDNILRRKRLANVHLVEPMGYMNFVAMMNRATLILTDSGGVQEEAPSLGKPVLVMRENTERPEAVEVGTVKLVGADREKIVSETSRLLTDAEAYDAMVRVHNPYGDGKASGRIVGQVSAFLRAKS